MICPECSQQMWNYEQGQMRCSNDHVFLIEDVVGKRKFVTRIDRPSTRERLQDFLLGLASGCGLAIAVEVLTRL